MLCVIFLTMCVVLGAHACVCVCVHGTQVKSESNLAKNVILLRRQCWGSKAAFKITLEGVRFQVKLLNDSAAA